MTWPYMSLYIFGMHNRRPYVLPTSLSGMGSSLCILLLALMEMLLERVPEDCNDARIFILLYLELSFKF
jgi:hypothetical protein